MTDPPGEDEAGGPAFSPAPPIDFRPDDPDHRLEAPPEAVAASEPEGFPGVAPRRLFDPGPVDGAGEPPAASGPPLWGTTPPPTDNFDDDRSDGNWVLVTVVLMLVFVAIAVGFTALTDSGGGGDVRTQLDGGDLGRAGAEGRSAPTTAAPSTTTTTAGSSSTAPPTTTTPAAGATWEVYRAPDGAFAAELPVPVEDVPAPEPGVREYRAVGDGVTYSIRSEPFAAAAPDAIALGLSAAIDAALPEGVTAERSGVQAFPGGVYVDDFTATVGASAVTGRAQVAGGRRFVLTATVATDRAQDPAVLADLIRFRNGFVPGS